MWHSIRFHGFGSPKTAGPFNAPGRPSLHPPGPSTNGWRDTKRGGHPVRCPHCERLALPDRTGWWCVAHGSFSEPAKPLVLAVHSHAATRRILELEFEHHEFCVTTAWSCESAVQAIEARRPDAVLLDGALPGMDGLSTLEVLHDRWPTIPVVFVALTPRATERQCALKLGASEIVQPYDVHEAVSSICAVLRRASALPARGPVRAGRVIIDLDRHLVTNHRGDTIGISPAGRTLLEHLAAHAGMPRPAADILEAVWGPEYRDDGPFLDRWIAHLRDIVELDPCEPKALLTHLGGGYSLQSSA